MMEIIFFISWKVRGPFFLAKARGLGPWPPWPFLKPPLSWKPEAYEFLVKAAEVTAAQVIPSPIG